VSLRSQFLIAATLLVLVSCDSPKQVEGEVFIKTKGGANVPLSLVNVSVFSSRSSVDTIEVAFQQWEKLGVQHFRKSYVLERLPTPDSTVRTDSQGRFHVTIPSHNKIYVLAQSSREVLDTTEEYCWLLPYSVATSGDNDKIILANHNLFE
jgi:hypothetical protein